jgi:hypothetical protein
VTAPSLLEAFDQTIAVVRRLEGEGLRTASGSSAGRELECLLDELVARRAGAEPPLVWPAGRHGCTL